MPSLGTGMPQQEAKCINGARSDKAAADALDRPGIGRPAAAPPKGSGAGLCSPVTPGLQPMN